MYTQLKNRKLYYDGISSYDPNLILKLQNYKVNWVDYLTPTINQFNKLSSDKKIQVKTESGPLDTNWNLPVKYLNMDVVAYVMDKHIEITADMDEDEIEERDVRLLTELELYRKDNKFDVLRTIIYIVEYLDQHKMVYGVGRGSSTSSYVLYVIGIHDIDSYLYDLPIDDFFHN